MPFREKRPDERVFRQLVPLSRPVCRADWRKSAGLFAYSPGVHCRDGLSAGASRIRTVSPTLRRDGLSAAPIKIGSRPVRATAKGRWDY